MGPVLVREARAGAFGHRKNVCLAGVLDGVGLTRGGLDMLGFLLEMARLEAEAATQSGESLSTSDGGDRHNRSLISGAGASPDDLYAISLAAPFPPPELMQRVSGLTSEADFAAHGRDIYRALEKASPQPLREFSAILDFGVGSGRLARLFNGFGGHYCGADVDHELLAWIAGALPWVQPLPTAARQVLPCGDHRFDCVISISVFTHMTEADSQFYLRELRRVARSGAVLLLTVHGRRALARALSEWAIADMLAIPRDEIERAKSAMDAGGFHFARQNGHLTTDEYDYGISFTSEIHIHDVWAKLFNVVKIVPGAIHDFQDIAVLRAD